MILALLIPPMQVLVVGGGPDKPHNQVAIESNVRYIARLLPADTLMRVLFSDGNPDSQNVQCQGEDGKIFYRAPQLPRLDGPAQLDAFHGEMQKLAAKPVSPIFLYFTGHGSSDRRSNFNNNRFDLWNDEELTVKDLAADIQTLPKGAPVTIVMVQCFSGAFGNLLFDHADPDGTLVDRPIAGFFAAVPSRMAAGCTPQIKESTYRDFSGYFFAALTGIDRIGRKVDLVDYDHNGRIGMSEAFCYCLLHDDSIDTPVCTADVFLRRFVTTPDPEVMKAPWASIRSWATPAQKAALDGLSNMLDLSGKDRAAVAYKAFINAEEQSEDLRDVRRYRFVRLVKSVVLAHTLATSGDRTTRTRYAELVKAEAGNPFKG